MILAMIASQTCRCQLKKCARSSLLIPFREKVESTAGARVVFSEWNSLSMISSDRNEMNSAELSEF